MAISSVTFQRVNGNLNPEAEGETHISGLVFDVSTYPGTAIDGDIFEIFGIDDAIALGVTEYDDAVGATNYEYGIPYYHIEEYFRVNPNGKLFVSFTNCTADWDIIEQMQRFAQGKIRQFGIYTRQKLWTPGATGTDPYLIQITPDLQTVVESLRGINQPASIILGANLVGIELDGTTTKIELIPDHLTQRNGITTLIGQGNNPYVRAIQLADTSNATVGWVGAALGLVSRTAVGSNIAEVAPGDILGTNLDLIELGFGDITIVDSDFTNMYPLESITQAKQDELEEKGLVFPIKYTGRSGTYACSERTNAKDDYRTISRNRTIDDSRRRVRLALLPFLNSKIKINPNNGQITIDTIAQYKSTVDAQLTQMQNNDDISGFRTYIDPKQNVLLNDTLKINYTIVPNGTAKQIEVKEGFSLTTSNV